MTLLGVLFLLHDAFPFRYATDNIVETIYLLFIAVLGLLNVFFADLFCLWRFHLTIISAPGGISVKGSKSLFSVSYLAH